MSDSALSDKPQPHSSSVIPAFRYQDAPAAIKWLCEVFGFKKRLVVPGANGAIDHAQLTIGSGMIMLGSARDDEHSKLYSSPVQNGGAVTQTNYVMVTDIEEHYDRARTAGAEIITELADQHYGGKLYTCRDLEGHVWNFGSFNPWADA
jgi:uncharacterized glyoxalase superfamily protein PhnB